MLDSWRDVADIGKVCRVDWRDVAGIGKVCRVGWRDVQALESGNVGWRDVAGRAGELWFFRLMKGLRMKNAGR